MTKQKDQQEALFLIGVLARPLVFHRALVDIPVVVNGKQSKLGVLGALMLNQAIRWQKEAGHTWFQKTLEEWHRETGMDEAELSEARCRLRETPFWNERELSKPGPRLYVFVDMSILADVLGN